MPKDTTEKKKKTTKKEIDNKETKTKKTTAKSTSTKKTAVSKTASSSKKSSSKETTLKTKKVTKRATTAKKTAAVKKSTTKATTKKKETTTKKDTMPKIEAVEYYDLPYRYNQTIVKILAQTPNTLFVYWDIADEDRKNYILDYGEEFFNSSKPILLIHNLTTNKSFEVEINDFANSWYLKMTEPNCKYEIELGRKIFRAENLNHNNNNDFIHITSSNNLNAPNDHVLLENIHVGTKVKFKNIKTNEVTYREYSSFKFMPNIYKLFDFYKNIYKDEITEDGNKAYLNNPSSSSFFK